MRRIFASGFRAGFVLSSRWTPSELNFPTREVASLTVIRTRANHFFMFLHRQCSTQSSPARTCDQDCLSPSLMHLDVGEVDLVSHVHVPAVIVQSFALSEDPSDCAGRAAAVSSQRSFVIGRDDGTGGFGNPMDGSSLFGPLDVVWATSWLGWVAASC